MVKPLPLPKVQQIAGHLDIKTTMRYIHGDLINETGSLQLSREERAAQKNRSKAGPDRSPDPVQGGERRSFTTAQDDESRIPDTAGTKTGLRLVSSSKN